MRVALLCHSTNPRGGVVHALELAEALGRLGHEAVTHAPDATGGGFFRRTGSATVAVPATPVASRDLGALVDARVDDYLRHFADPANRRFDVFHAQDAISGNALATLKARGLIEGFARTVHHTDAFPDPRVAALQDRSIVEADAHCVVSPAWRETMRERYGLTATVVGNGVDRKRFSPGPPTPRGEGPVFLSVGGVEARKNSVRLLEAFSLARAVLPGARLVVAGGSSLLDHGATRARYDAALSRSGLPDGAVTILGPVADDAVPGLYRDADALVFPSLEEGFGLVVLEAMASGLPVVVSRVAPFTGYLGARDAAWCDPRDVASIAAAMLAAVAPGARAEFGPRGLEVAARHDWDRVARAHLDVYATLARVGSGGAFAHA